MDTVVFYMTLEQEIIKIYFFPDTSLFKVAMDSDEKAISFVKVLPSWPSRVEVAQRAKAAGFDWVMVGSEKPLVSPIETLIKKRMSEALISPVPWVRELAENLYDT